MCSTEEAKGLEFSRNSSWFPVTGDVRCMKARKIIGARPAVYNLSFELKRLVKTFK